MTATVAAPAATPAHLTDFDLTVDAQLLWAAAQCAHTDPYKGPIYCIELECKWNDSETVWVGIRSTNGHIAFRCSTLAKGRCDMLTSSESGSHRILLKAEHLRKVLKTEKTIVVTRVAGELRVSGFKMGIRTDCEYVAGATYPNLDKLWPDTSTMQCSLGGPIAFSGTYLEILGKIAQRVTERGVLRLYAETPRTATVLQTSSTEHHNEPAFLLMPVQVRE